MDKNSISEYLHLKIKDRWVKRYAKVDILESCFSYKTDFKDFQVSHTIFLANAKIVRSKSQNIITIEKGTNDN